MSKQIHNYPTEEQVLIADRYYICMWHRFLRYPQNDEELSRINLITSRFKELGGMTPEISKSLEW